MSDFIQHECGIAMIRLLKPMSYYHKKYGTALYGINKLHLLMQKQKNRGQDGVGIATIKLDPKQGKRYISRKRSNSPQALKDVFDSVYDYFNDLSESQMGDTDFLKQNKPYIGELLMGHLRYGTHGENSIEKVHPFLRSSNWIGKNLLLAGNFNLTNVNYLFDNLVDLGQYPKDKSDSVTILEKIGHFLDEEIERLHTWYKPEFKDAAKRNELITHNIDIRRILERSSRKFDGGYVITGMLGHGDAFAFRDPNGIRPAFYYQDDEIVVVSSERPALQTTMGIKIDAINEIPRGAALIIKKDGRVSIEEVLEKRKETQCSFERIYFSRGTDRDIYLERKKLGAALVDATLKAIDYDFDNTVFSYVPNTAETAFVGLINEVEKRLNKIKAKEILNLGKKCSEKKIRKILDHRVRVENIVVKDAKLRTFIADDSSRNELVSHVYDVTYGIVKNHIDTLVLLDDSIVRGTTLKDSIISIVNRLNPKKIVIVSSAPQIRYPDCYGIDMSKMKEFAAFRALVGLLEDHNKTDLLQKTYKKCKKQLKLSDKKMKNVVKELYGEFSTKELTQKITEILTPKDINAEVQIIFQDIDGLHNSCPGHTGDWYFTGNYPTPGGNRVINQAFVNYIDGVDGRGY